MENDHLVYVGDVVVLINRLFAQKYSIPEGSQMSLEMLDKHHKEIPKELDFRTNTGWKDLDKGLTFMGAEAAYNHFNFGISR